MMKMKIEHPFIVMLIVVLSGCGGCGGYTPKPHGYPRVEYPVKEYKTVRTDCSFQLTIPSYSVLEHDDKSDAEPCWYNLKFLPFDATLHLTYKEFGSIKELDSLTEDAYTMAMKHTIKATEIKELDNVDTSTGNLIMKYDLSGNTATPFNFYVTDGQKHFLRGSFYFNHHTKTDSIAPIYDFIKEDLDKLVNEVIWLDNKDQ